jgi:iron complex outermembrane receptor protein
MSPSLVVTSDAGAGVGYTGMRIRGTDLRGINVTLNGIPVNDGESSTVFFVDLPDLASSLDDVQIQRGVGTSTNGAAAFGASINMKTDEYAPDPYAGINTAYGSFNTLKSNVKFGTGLMNGKWNFNGRLSSITSDGFIDRASSDLKSAYFSAAYYGEKDVLKAVVILGKEKTYQAWYGIPKDSLEGNRTYNPAGEIYDADGNFIGFYDNQTDNYWQNYYQLHYAREFAENLNFTASAFYTRGYGYYENYKNNKSFSSFGMNDTIIGGDTITHSNMVTQKWLDNHFYGLNFSMIYEAAALKLTIGGGWNRYDGDHFGKVVWAQVARLGDYNHNWYFNNGLKTKSNIFAKAEYAFGTKLTAFADLQYRYIDYRIEGTHDDLRNLTQEHQFDFLNPKLGLAFKINEKNNLFLSAAISNREPDRSTYRDADPGVEVKPERLTDIEFGYSFVSSKLAFTANVFHMQYKDQLVLTGKINNVGDAIMQNVDKSHRSGLEVIAGWAITDFLKWDANATFSVNKIDGFVAYVDDWNTGIQREENYDKTDISFSPGFMANSNLTVIPFKNFSISLLSSYVGKQFTDNTSDDRRSIDAYFVNNVRVNYSLKTNFIKQIDFLLSLNNVLNEKYETNAWVYRYYYDDVEYDMNGYFPQAGFNFMLGLNLNF